jgi:hypothetical protein
MKIDTSRLFPLYAAWADPEDQLAHALVQTLGRSENLLSRFIKEMIHPDLAVQGKTLSVFTRRMHEGDGHSDQTDDPGAWITSRDNAIGIIIGVRNAGDRVVKDRLVSLIEQLSSYENRVLLVLTPDPLLPTAIADLQKEPKQDLWIVWHAWGELHQWFGRLKKVPLFTKPKESLLIDALCGYLASKPGLL